MAAAGSSSGLQEPRGHGFARLQALASHLAPAIVRIIGPDADRVIYEMSDASIEEDFELVSHVIDRGHDVSLWELGPETPLGGSSSAC